MKSLRCLLSFLSVLLVLPAVARAQLWSGLINANRAIDWTQAGIPGGLPDASWPICATVSAYSGSASTINSALSSCSSAHPGGGVVVLGSGTFTLSSSISFPQNTQGHLVLRGQGANSTHLLFTGAGTSGHIFISGSDTNHYRGAAWSGISVTGGLSQDSTTLTLSSVSGITTNVSALIMVQCDTGFSGAGCTGNSVDNNGYFECASAWTSTGHGCAVSTEGPDGSNWIPGGQSWQTEMFLVTGINGNNVTISRPLHHPNWSTGQSAQVQPFKVIPQDGIENLWVDSSGDEGSSSSPGPNGIELVDCYQCWVSGVEASNSGSHDIYIYQCINSVVQNSYTYGNPVSYGDNTGIWVANGSFNLIQNNICHRTASCNFNDGPEEGDVVAYNYAAGLTSGTGTVGQLNSGSETHSAGDNFMLYEGNIWTRSDDDLDHGLHLNQTYFRNLLLGYDSWVNGGHGTYTSVQFGTWAYSNGFGSRYTNIIANVLGTPGVQTTYNWTASDSNQFGSNYIYILGAGSTASGPGSDPLAQCSVAGTNMCWGNWDVVNNAAQWNSSEVSSSAPSFPNSVPVQGVLPKSFLYSSAPSWWPSSVPFPAIGPDVTGGNVGQCGGSINQTSQAGLPATSSSQCGSGQPLNSAWAGHVNANPAMACYLRMGGLPDGSGSILTFSATQCYGSVSSSSPTTPPPSGAPNPPTNLSVVVD